MTAPVGEVRSPTGSIVGTAGFIARSSQENWKSAWLMSGKPG